MAYDSIVLGRFHLRGSFDFLLGYHIVDTEKLMTICTYDTMCRMGIRTLPAVLSTMQDEYQRNLIVDFEGIRV